MPVYRFQVKLSTAAWYYSLKHTGAVYTGLRAVAFVDSRAVRGCTQARNRKGPTGGSISRTCEVGQAICRRHLDTRRDTPLLIY